MTARRILAAQAEKKAMLDNLVGPLELPIVGHPRVLHVQVVAEGDGLFSVLFTAVAGQEIDASFFEVEPGAPLHPLYSTGFQEHLVPEAVAVILYSLDEDVLSAKYDALWDGEDCEINLYPGYAEPGYSLGEGKTGVALANWNHFDNEFCDWVEDVKGYAIEWSDEWIECEDCGMIFRTSPDSYSWMQYGVFEPHPTCGNCVKSDPGTYLYRHEGKVKQAMTIDIDPAEHDYLLVNPKGKEFESGWHPGQTDDPQKIAAQLVLKGAKRWLFKVTGKGQFDIEFAVYLHKSDQDVLDACRTALFG